MEGINLNSKTPPTIIKTHILLPEPVILTKVIKLKPNISLIQLTWKRFLIQNLLTAQSKLFNKEATSITSTEHNNKLDIAHSQILITKGDINQNLYNKLNNCSTILNTITQIYVKKVFKLILLYNIRKINTHLKLSIIENINKFMVYKLKFKFIEGLTKLRKIKKSLNLKVI